MLKCPCHHCGKRNIGCHGRCPERSREIPCRDFEIKRELIKERVKNKWRYADKALKLIGDDKNA